MRTRWLPLSSTRSRWWIPLARLGCFGEGELQVKNNLFTRSSTLPRTVLSSGLREKSIWHSAMQIIFMAHILMIYGDVWMVCKMCVCVWQPTCVPCWFITFLGVTTAWIIWHFSQLREAIRLFTAQHRGSGGWWAYKVQGVRFKLHSSINWGQYWVRPRKKNKKNPCHVFWLKSDIFCIKRRAQHLSNLNQVLWGSKHSHGIVYVSCFSWYKQILYCKGRYCRKTNVLYQHVRYVNCQRFLMMLIKNESSWHDFR